MFVRLHFPFIDAKREGCIEQHATHPTHCLLVIARSPHTGSPVHGRGVDPTLGGSLQTDEPVLAPVGTPGVTNQPVGEGSTEKYLVEKIFVFKNTFLRWSVFSAVSNQLDSVVDGDVLVKAATIKDSTLVTSPT